ncbi:MAG: nucleotidyltransferase domain-containing protein [Acidobacteria bacterium]|nr:nucleotidyltransferase domain-containing protein [Acidobacteriota bacterium]
MERNVEDLVQEFRDELESSVGSNLEQVILYGSRARGDEDPDSDLDVLVVLRDSSQSERETIHRIAYRLMWDREFQPLISLNIIDREHYLLLKEAGSSYLGNILREGKPLWPTSETKVDIGWRGRTMP